jgi:hypothetical protein
MLPGSGLDVVVSVDPAQQVAEIGRLLAVFLTVSNGSAASFRMIMSNRERCLRQPSQQSPLPDHGCGDPDKVAAIFPSSTAATEALVRSVATEAAGRSVRP